MNRSKTRRLPLAAFVVASLSLPAIQAQAGAPAYEPEDTQAAGEGPADPRAAMRRMEVPEGFRVTLAAAEPDVRQPIAIAFDPRGRLWVAESYSYDGSDFTEQAHDRILIFEDEDGDGTFDRRTVFHDRLNRLTGLEVGFGGVWVTAPPHLLFIADGDHDDRPDGAPVVLLDGWSLHAEHNSVNGLTWGPDGWLYGRHGIKAPSAVGRPGTPDADRVALSCCIWRYHPVRHAFEVVADGTVNPWGLDFDEYGQGFFTTSVVDHLWHLIPGAHYRRSHGEDDHPDPHVYALLDPISDHRHWGGGTRVEDRRAGPGTGALGGGHSHSGALIYLGDNWPGRYRGTLLMSNIHGHRINRDTLRRRGSTYVAEHAPDFLAAHDDWFRAVSLACGPDGGVFVTDWSDLGECHDRDGVHRTSGRIYKVCYGRPRLVRVDLMAESDRRLAGRHRDRNEWFARQARRILHERAAAGRDLGEAHAVLRDLFEGEASVPLKLRALWTLWLTGGVDAAEMRRLLGHENEHVRAWAVRLLCDDRPPAPEALRTFAAMAARDDSPLVRLTLASALRRVVPDGRRPALEALALRGIDADDPSIPRMIWYALEPLVGRDPERAATLAVRSPIPTIRRFVARRLASDLGHPDTSGPPALFAALRDTPDPEVRGDLLAGMVESLRGRRRVRVAPEGPAIVRRVAEEGDARVKALATTVLLVLGDPAALRSLEAVVADRDADPGARAEALRDLASQRPAGLPPLLFRLIAEGQLVAPALQALRSYDHPETGSVLVGNLPRLDPGERRLAIETLAARASSAVALLDAVEAGAIPARAITADQARQVVNLGDEALVARLQRLWGQVRSTPAETRAEIKRLRRELSQGAFGAADPEAGRRVFVDRCASCHRLHGEGGTVGPDLTGADRRDLDYLLTNILDPGAAVAADYRVSVVLTGDGRVITGIVSGGDDNTLTIRTATETIKLDRGDVDEVRPSPGSMMPDGLLRALTRPQVRDLLGYLSAPP